MLPATINPKRKSGGKPCVLIVDDEPAMLEMVGDVVGKSIDCRLLLAKDLAHAEQLMRSEETIELLITDVHLPDGDGMNLLPSLRKVQPHAGAVIITGDRSVHGAVEALRAGAMDFLAKPFNASDLVARITGALERQKNEKRESRRLVRLKTAVTRLNQSRRTVSKKVDLLCNDLITAYGELSRQMEEVRVGGAFSKLLAEAKDLEQLLCHTMDWLLRKIGYCNVAIWLASEENEFELGAYMKYTIAGEPALTDAMRTGLLPHVLRDNVLQWSATEIAERLSGIEAARLREQNILAINCTYLGEPLAAFILFRDQKAPFSDDDVNTLKSIAPIFSVALAAAVRGAEGDDEVDGDLDEEGDERRDSTDRNGDKKGDKRSDADWWKNGGPPPF